MPRSRVASAAALRITHRMCNSTRPHTPAPPPPKKTHVRAPHRSRQGGQEHRAQHIRPRQHQDGARTRPVWRRGEAAHRQPQVCAALCRRGSGRASGAVSCVCVCCCMCVFVAVCCCGLHHVDSCWHRTMRTQRRHTHTHTHTPGYVATSTCCCWETPARPSRSSSSMWRRRPAARCTPQVGVVKCAPACFLGA
jgi:hypothetical protein